MSLHTPVPHTISPSAHTYTGTNGYIRVQQSLPLEGNIHLSGAKNSSLASSSKSPGIKWEQRPDLSNNGREWLQFSKFFISSF